MVKEVEKREVYFEMTFSLRSPSPLLKLPNREFKQRRQRRQRKRRFKI